jgi:two-component system OmpR family sensor kinase
MKVIPDTIAGRTIAVLLVGFLVFHAISICAYQIGVDSEVDLTNEIRLAERLFTIKRALASLPPTEREKTAHSLSGGPIEVHWSNVPLTVENTHDEAISRGLRRRLLELAPEVGTDGLRVGVPSPISGRTDDPHLVLVSMKLADASWTNFSLTKLSGTRATLTNVVLSTSLMALGVIVLLIVVLRSVTRPIRQCAAAAQQLYVNAEPHPIAVSGPREVRDLATAFNGLQQRVKRLVDDRTLMLAAISHDLKTPLTRAQLRIEDIESADLRRHIDADLHEMLMMIDSTLQFIKGDQAGEVVRDVELNAILESICNDLSDLGFAVSFAPEGKIVLRGRHLALKRAFNNLIVNAANYGRQARVAVAQVNDAVEIVIDDDGPGIPLDQREAVFAPFYRLESSRNRETGGTGLGLTVARTIIRGHGGDVTLHAAPSGGLRVRVSLPATQQSSGNAK